ncbi:MAG: hypothetical protein ABIH37_02260 [archaeon]
MKRFFKGFMKGQKAFGNAIALLINTVLLTIVYFIGVGLTSIFARAFHKEFLDEEIKKQDESYWTELNLTKKQRRDYYRQF